MKKTLKQVLMFVAFMAAPVTMNAQVNEGKTINGNLGWHYIPKVFTYDGVSYIIGYKNDYESGVATVKIYNDELVEIKSFTASSDIGEFEPSVMDLDSNSYLYCSFSASQTLFNTDEKYEYMLPLYEDPEADYPKTIGFRVMSEDGTELQSISFDLPNTEKTYFDDDMYVLKINGKYYLVFMGEVGDEDITIFYSINPQSTEIKAVANIPASFVGNYSLDGRRQGKMQRGVNILRESDGTAKKVLVK